MAHSHSPDEARMSRARECIGQVSEVVLSYCEPLYWQGVVVCLVY